MNSKDKIKRIKTLQIGGVMRCCVETINEFDDSQSKEGDTVKCKYCEDKLTLQDGKWQWFSKEEL